MYIDGSSLVLLYQIHGVLNVAQAALAQHVELVETQRFGVIHIEMGDGEALGHHLQGGEMMDRAFGDDDAPRVDRQIVGKAFQPAAVVQDGFRQLVVFFQVERIG